MIMKNRRNPHWSPSLQPISKPRTTSHSEFNAKELIKIIDSFAPILCTPLFRNHHPPLPLIPLPKNRYHVFIEQEE